MRCRAVPCTAVPCLPDGFGWFRSRRFGPRMAGLCGSRSARKASSYESITQPHTLLPPLQGPISPTHSERMRSEAHSSQATTACGATHLSTLTHTRARTRTSTHTRARTQRAVPGAHARARAHRCCRYCEQMGALSSRLLALISAVRTTELTNSHGYLPHGQHCGPVVYSHATDSARHGRFSLSCCGWTGGGAAG